MTVSLPGPLKDWIEKQVEEGEYASSSDYVGHLVRRDRENKDNIAAIRHLIEEAEASGMSMRSIDEVFAEARAQARRLGLLRG